jgi:DNA polymerase V
LSADRQTEVLARLPVAGVWGIGTRRAEQLQALGIETALQLRDSDPLWLRACFSVVMQRLVYELRGNACLPLEDVAPPRRQLWVSRVFGRPVTRLKELQQAIAVYTAQAAAKLRRQHARVQTLLVWIQTQPCRDQDPQPHASLDFRQRNCTPIKTGTYLAFYNVLKIPMALSSKGQTNRLRKAVNQ